MSLSDPNFLDRWLDRNPLSALTRCRFFLVVPAFNIPSTWLGYSDIVGAYNYVSPNNFVLKDFGKWVPSNPNYTLCVAYANNDGSVVRYRLWTAVGEKFYSMVPQYNGQVIKKLFRFEIWNGSAGAVSQAVDLTPILTSVLQNVDYRYGTDLLLVQPSALITFFGCVGSGLTLAPDMTGLMVWLDATQGITISGGNSVSAWADRTGHIIMQQANASLQPTRSLVGYVQFLGDANMASNVVINQGITKYYAVIFNGFVVGPNANNVFNQNGLVNSARLNLSVNGGYDASFGFSVVHGNYGTGITVVELDTLTGQVWTHDTVTGASTLQGTSPTTFSDVLNLILGGGNGGIPELDEQGNFELDENGHLILTEGGGIPTGFNILDLLAYTSQTAAARAITLQYLLSKGFPLPLTFPANATLVPNQ